MINKIYKHYGKADYNSMMNEGKTLEDIFNEASSDTEYIHIEFQHGVVAYGIAMKDGNIIGAAGNVISYNDAERARFTEEYEQRKAQGKDTTADDFTASTRYAWERDYVISTLTDILVGGEITAYNMYAVKGADPIVYTDPMTIPQALQAATDEANKRIDEFTRIGLKSIPLDSVFFEISEDVDLRKFAETSDVNKLIILASQANANLWEGIMRSGGFKTSEVYARIADDVLSGQLILVDRDGNRLTSEHETEAVAADEDEGPVIEAPQYETIEPADNDDNVSTVDRLSVQDGEQSTYNNADANPDNNTVDAISAPDDDEPAQDTVSDEQHEDNESESTDDNEIEINEPAQSTEDDTETPTDTEIESEPVDNTVESEETDTPAEESDEQLTDESAEVDDKDELPKHGDADNDGIANGVDTDPYHADVEPTDENETESDNADTVNTSEPSEPVNDNENNADDNTVNTPEDNEHDETSPKTTEFKIPDIELPTLSTTEFNAVNKNESETEVNDDDELPKHGDADNDGIANAVDADPYNANVGSTEDETEVEPTEDESAKQDSDTVNQDSDTENTSESDDENEQEDDSESEETDSDTETETESDKQSDDYSESESEPAPVVKSEPANANYNTPAYADEKAVALFTTGLDDVDSELDSITDRRASLENTISEQDARIDNIHDIERQIGDMKAKTSRLEGMLDGMKAEADSYHDDVNEAKAELDKLDAREAELGKRSEWLHRAQEVLKQAGLL